MGEGRQAEGPLPLPVVGTTIQNPKPTHLKPSLWLWGLSIDQGFWVFWVFFFKASCVTSWDESPWPPKPAYVFTFTTFGVLFEGYF